MGWATFFYSYVISTPTCRNWKIWNPKVASASKVYMSQRVKFTALKKFMNDTKMHAQSGY